MLLPFVDQKPLYDQLDYEFPGDPADCFAALDAAPGDPGGVVVPVFLCPSDPNGGRINRAHPGWGSHLPIDYLGVSGTTPTAHDGVLFSGSRVRAGDVTDGMSNTLAWGERAIPRNLEHGWLLCGAGTDPLASGNQDHHLSMSIGLAPGTDEEIIVPPFNKHDDHFWSWHTGGAHFALADGSVRFLSNSTDLRTLRRLATRAGNDVVGEF
jgi:prepilin-type processing-associated H-X9-DG protein